MVFEALRSIVRNVGFVVEIAVIPYLFGLDRPPNTESNLSLYMTVNIMFNNSVV